MCLFSKKIYIFFNIYIYIYIYKENKNWQYWKRIEEKIIKLEKEKPTEK